MNCKILKIFSVLMLILFILYFVMPYSDAVSIGGVNVSPSISGNNAATSVSNLGNQILGIIQVIGTIIAVGMLLYLGIKYIISSPDDRASIKHSAFIYIVGAFVLFTAVTLVNIIYNFATSAVK